MRDYVRLLRGGGTVAHMTPLMINNARKVWRYYRKNFSNIRPEIIAGMLGNFAYEGMANPIYTGSKRVGYSLFLPSEINNFRAIGGNGNDFELKALGHYVNGKNGGGALYNGASFNKASSRYNSPEDFASLFGMYYERNKGNKWSTYVNDANYKLRRSAARYFYNLFSKEDLQLVLNDSIQLLLQSMLDPILYAPPQSFLEGGYFPEFTQFKPVTYSIPDSEELVRPILEQPMATVDLPSYLQPADQIDYLSMLIRKKPPKTTSTELISTSTKVTGKDDFVKQFYNSNYNYLTQTMHLPDTQAQRLATYATALAGNESGFGTAGNKHISANNFVGIDGGNGNNPLQFVSMDDLVSYYWNLIKRKWPNALNARSIEQFVIDISSGSQTYTGKFNDTAYAKRLRNILDKQVIPRLS